jgi:monofunctional biosynthetic peptidoglycan transglycosylase
MSARLEPPPLAGLRAPSPRRLPPSRPPRGAALRILLCALAAPVLLALGAIVALRWLPPPTTSFMLQSRVKPVHYRWVPARAIAKTMERAVVAAEDQKFWTHHGFDVEAIEQAYEHNRRGRHVRGASTISQQTAKNLFLWPGGGYFRKALEAGLTVLLETLWGKQRILEVYLNIAQFGPGIYGVEVAAQSYFHEHASQLSAEQAARLAAVLPNPDHWRVLAPGPYVQSRVAWILGQMGYRTAQTPAEEPSPPPGEAPPPDDDGGAASPY